MGWRTIEIVNTETKEIPFCDDCGKDVDVIWSCWGHCGKGFCDECKPKNLTNYSEWVDLCKECAIIYGEKWKKRNEIEKKGSVLLNELHELNIANREKKKEEAEGVNEWWIDNARC